MGDFWDDLDLDSDVITEVIVLFIVVVLAVVAVVILCCHVRKKAKERQKRGELVEEAGSFFSFHEAIPDSVPSQPGPLAAFYRSTVFSLSGNKMYPGLPYSTVPQTPLPGHRPGMEVGPEGALLLPTGQHVTTPIYPPSYFATAPYDSTPPPKGSSPPPPYPE